MANCNTKLIIIYILDILLVLFLILSIIYSSKIIKHTSSSNPFKLEEESDKMNYFKNNNISLYYQDKAYCICGNNTFLDYCNEDLINSGCKNIYKNNNLRNLKKFSQCEEIQDKIINENVKLKDIFELKTVSIHSSIISLVTLNIIVFIIIILYFPIRKLFVNNANEAYKDYHAEKNEKEKTFEDKKLDCIDCCCFYGVGSMCLVCIIILIILVIFILLIVIIVIFSVSCGKYDDDNTGKFLDFLECPNVNKEGFYKYSSIVDLSSYFSKLKIFQSFLIIIIFIYELYMIFEKCFEL